MNRYVLSEPASMDLAEIWLFIAEDSEAAADALLDRIHEAFPKLARMPGMGRERRDLAPGLRSFPVGNYQIFYRVFQNGIEIVRVLHGARDIESLFS